MTGAESAAVDDGFSARLSQSLAGRAAEFAAAFSDDDPGLRARLRVEVEVWFRQVFKDDETAGLMRRFDAPTPTLAQAAQATGALTAYQDRIFHFFFLFDVLKSMRALPDLTTRALGLAGAMGVEAADAAALAHEFGLVSGPPAEASGILSLTLSGPGEGGDVELPLPGLALTIHKIRNIYSIARRNDIWPVTVDGQSLKRRLSTRITRRFTMNVGGSVIRRGEILHWFRAKAVGFTGSLYVNDGEGGPALDFSARGTPLARLDFSGCSVRLAALDPDAAVALRGGRPGPSETVYLNDFIYINGYRLAVRDALALAASRHILAAKGRTRFSVTNDPKGDFFIEDDLDRVWTATLAHGPNGPSIDPGDCPYRAYLGDHSAKPGETAGPGQAHFLHDTFLYWDAQRGVFIQSVFSFRKLTAQGLVHRFDNGKIGLDEASFELGAGEFAAIMGPSGSGKSTLLSCASGLLGLEAGQVRVDNYDVHADYNLIKDYFGFTPQDDLLLPNLTVGENLFHHARLRFPERSRAELDARVDAVLAEIGLLDRKDVRVGDPTRKTLSGGERKRCNIGLELLADAQVFFLDEPTSGLSSKDAEKVIDLLDGLAKSGRIVLVVLHQPGRAVFNRLDKVILLDRGGRQAYFGAPDAALAYFQDVGGVDPFGRDEDGSPLIACPRCGAQEPELLLNVLEESLIDVDGRVLDERKHPPEFWKRLYRRRVTSSWFSSVAAPRIERLPPTKPISPSERLKQFGALFSRNFLNKLRDRANLGVTFLEAPLLGLAVGFILKYAPGDAYSLYTNDLYRTFLFTAVITVLFLAMTNSVDEIVEDAALFLRERMLNTTHRGYLAAKLLAPMLFAAVQNGLFWMVSLSILELRELWLEYWLFSLVLSFTGVSAGLFISALPKMTGKAAGNITPLVLVPQIILGGALIEYEKMNASLRLYKNNPVPEICQLMPSRWAFEGLLTLQETGNSYDAAHSRKLKALREFKLDREAYVARFGEAAYAAEEDRLDDELEAFRAAKRGPYGNKNIHDAVELGEKERRRRLEGASGEAWTGFNPMFVRTKALPLVDKVVSTPVYNGLVLFGMAVAVNIATLVLLKRRETMLWGARRAGRLVRLFARRMRR